MGRAKIQATKAKDLVVADVKSNVTDIQTKVIIDDEFEGVKVCDLSPTIKKIISQRLALKHKGRC